MTIIHNIKTFSSQLLNRRGFLIFVGFLSCVYALIVLFYVPTVPDLGLQTVFGTTLRKTPPGPFLKDGQSEGERRLEKGDKLVQVGNLDIANWSDVLNAPFKLRDSRLREALASGTELPWAQLDKDDGVWVKVEFENEKENQRFVDWRPLVKLPIEDLVPSVLWFFLKMLLFTVGALVLWKRPADSAAAQFFVLCVVTLGAYMGGYNWNHIVTQPGLILVFMVCAVLLPVVSLHFYFVFPRKKAILVKYPRATLAAIYGLPLVFLALMVFCYLRLYLLVHHRQPDMPKVPDADFATLKNIIYVYFGVAAVWYLACVGSLVHSYRTVADQTERNQVKWIMYGAFGALVPIGFSLYLALLQPDEFAAGATTWPMFAASACLTGAFAVSITRYRLMELDKIISSSVGYFLISFLAGLLFYGVVFVGTLIFNQWVKGPEFKDAVLVSTTALLLMLILDQARSRFKKALDRRFSRDKSQLDRTLQQMSQAVQQLVDPPALAQRLLQATTELMGVSRGSVFLRQGDPPLYRLQGSLGSTPSLEELSSGCPLIEALKEGNIVSLRQRSTPGQTPAQRQLQLLGGEIAHPLAHEGRLLALLVLGPKDSPYRADDFNLLAAFAQITVLALESAEGHRTIEGLNVELQAKLEKISEQQRRILALQSQLSRQSRPADDGKEDPDKPAEPAGLSPSGIVGSSPVLQQLLGLVRKVATTQAAVLIRGESGTGKELLARAVHENSLRAGKPFVKVHCAALSANLLESELFGHVKGSFTGAHRDKMGRFELANGGTLFLDEIGDINLDVQTKLLRVLQEKVLERVGSSEPVQVDVRIVTATHQNLENFIRLGKFREDLYYRLNVFPIEVPPLRDRVEDIAELATLFMRQSAQKCLPQKELDHIDDDALALLKAYSWPGNIRQLENVIERAVVICDKTYLSVDELSAEIVHNLEIHDRNHAAAGGSTEIQQQRFLPRRAERDQLEREQLVRALAAAAGNKAEAARVMGVARSTLVSRLKKLGLS